MHIGQPPVDAVVAERQFLVVDAEQMQNRRVHIVAIGRIVGGFVGPFVAFAVSHAAFDAAARQPIRERERIVIAAFAPWLHGIRPNSVVQITIVSSSMPRAFRSLISAAAGLSMLRAHFEVILGEVFVAVPVAARETVVRAAPDLHETHAAFEQAPGNQAIACRNLR